MNRYPISTRLLVDGVEAAASGPELIAGEPTVLDPLTLSWGRTNSVDQPDFGTCTFTIRQQLDTAESPSLLDIIRGDALVEVWIDVRNPEGADPDEIIASRMVWAGNVTTAVGRAAGDYAIEVYVTAVELAAPLADETIGNQPWPVQPVQTRVDRILSLARTATYPVAIADSVAWVELSRLDVASEPPLGMLQNIAQSVGGVIWPTAWAWKRTTGTSETVTVIPYLWLEDPRERPSIRYFAIQPDGTVTIEPIPADEFPDGSAISAADLVRDPVQWTRDKTQKISSVDISWREQSTNAEGQPEVIDRIVTRTEPGSRIVRKMSVDTDLTTQLDAERLAAQWLSLAGQTGGWTASGISIDTRVLTQPEDLEVTDGLTYLERLTSITALLDSRERLGRLITIVGLPEWAPGGTQVSVYAEGGSYTLQGGAWMLDLNVVDASAQGKSAAFGDFAGTMVRPADFVGIRGIDTWGVAGPLGSFYDMKRDGDTAYVSAHRGGSYIVPEGTTVGRLNARDLGMQVIDGGDIHATSDGVLFDMHDLTVDRTTNLTGLLSEMTAAELQQGVIDCSVWFGGGWSDQPITSIADTLDELGGETYITLEIKNETGALENCQKAVQMITDRRLNRQILIASFTESLLAPAIAAGIETMLLGSTGTAIPGSGLLSRGIRYFGGSTAMTSETAKAIMDEGIRVVTYSTEQHADVNKYRSGPSGDLYGYISDDPHYLKEHVLGTYSYRLTADPFDSLTWYHGMQPDNFNVHPDYRGSFQPDPGGAFYCAPVSSQRRAVLQGWACPLVSPDSYTITWEQDFLQHDTTAGGALVFGCPDDAPFTGDDQAGGGVGPAPGYVLFLFSSGLVQLFRRDPDTLPVALGELNDGVVITPGTPTQMSVTVTPTQITVTKNGAPAFTVNDDTYRGGYLHLLANAQGAAAGVRWRNITTS